MDGMAMERTAETVCILATFQKVAIHQWSVWSRRVNMVSDQTAGRLKIFTPKWLDSLFSRAFALC